MAQLLETEGPATINREWGKRRITVQCNVRGRDVGSFVEEARREIAAKVELPTGYYVRFGGQFEHLQEARARLAADPHVVLLDVREDREWQKDHAAEAVHLGKGILERDLEKLFPNPNTELIMYCGGGFRSALTTEVARRMGYRNVFSLAGGYKAMVMAGWPMKRGD